MSPALLSCNCCQATSTTQQEALAFTDMLEVMELSLMLILGEKLLTPTSDVKKKRGIWALLEMPSDLSR